MGRPQSFEQYVLPHYEKLYPVSRQNASTVFTWRHYTTIIIKSVHLFLSQQLLQNKNMLLERRNFAAFQLINDWRQQVLPNTAEVTTGNSLLGFCFVFKTKTNYMFYYMQKHVENFNTKHDGKLSRVDQACNLKSIRSCSSTQRQSYYS